MLDQIHAEAAGAQKAEHSGGEATGGERREQGLGLQIHGPGHQKAETPEEHLSPGGAPVLIAAAVDLGGSRHGDQRQKRDGEGEPNTLLFKAAGGQPVLQIIAQQGVEHRVVDGHQGASGHAPQKRQGQQIAQVAVEKPVGIHKAEGIEPGDKEIEREALAAFLQIQQIGHQGEQGQNQGIAEDPLLQQISQTLLLWQQQSPGDHKKEGHRCFHQGGQAGEQKSYRKLRHLEIVGIGAVVVEHHKKDGNGPQQLQIKLALFLKGHFPTPFIVGAEGCQRRIQYCSRSMFAVGSWTVFS